MQPGSTAICPASTYSQADALDLPFGDGDFDGVVCQFGIMFFPDKAKGMSEMTRVLRPGGVLGLNVWDSLDKNPTVKIVDSVIKQHFETDPATLPGGSVRLRRH